MEIHDRIIPVGDEESNYLTADFCLRDGSVSSIFRRRKTGCRIRLMRKNARWQPLHILQHAPHLSSGDRRDPALAVGHAVGNQKASAVGMPSQAGREPPRAGTTLARGDRRATSHARTRARLRRTVRSLRRPCPGSATWQPTAHPPRRPFEPCERLRPLRARRRRGECPRPARGPCYSRR